MHHQGSAIKKLTLEDLEMALKKDPVFWQCTVGGNDYDCSYEQIKKEHVVTINGTPHTVKAGFMSGVFGLDEAFFHDGEQARLVIEKGMPDIVIGGVYAISGKEYRKRPAWAMLFIIVCLAIPVVSLGGALPFVIGIGGAGICIGISKGKLPIVVRVLFCLIITLAAWVVTFLLVLGVAYLRS